MWKIGILGMDKEGGGYYFILEKYENCILFKIQLNIS